MVVRKLETMMWVDGGSCFNIGPHMVPTSLTRGLHLPCASPTPLRLFFPTLPLNLNGDFNLRFDDASSLFYLSKELNLLLGRRCFMQMRCLYFHYFPSGFLHFLKCIFSNGILHSTFNSLSASFFKDCLVLSERVSFDSCALPATMSFASLRVSPWPLPALPPRGSIAWLGKAPLAPS